MQNTVLDQKGFRALLRYVGSTANTTFKRRELFTDGMYRGEMGRVERKLSELFDAIDTVQAKARDAARRK